MQRPSHLSLFETPSGYYDRRGLSMFVLTYIGAFVCAALLAYPVYLSFQWIGAGHPEESFRGWLAEQRISRIADRLRLLAAAGGTLWLIGYAGLWGRFGFSGERERRWLILGGWVLVGVATFAVPLALQLLAGTSALRLDLNEENILGLVAAALATAVVVSFLEESIFRGMLLRLFATAVKPWPALLLSAVVFAAVHFKSVKWMGIVEPSWEGALRVVSAQFLAPVFTFQVVLFASLFAVGLVLNLLFWKTGNLYASFGLHAGWVLAQRLSVNLFESTTGSGPSWLGTPLVTDGILGVSIILILAVWLMRGMTPRKAAVPVGAQTS